jgi:hypothetical protein
MFAGMVDTMNANVLRLADVPAIVFRTLGKINKAKQRTKAE